MRSFNCAVLFIVAMLFQISIHLPYYRLSLLMTDNYLKKFALEMSASKKPLMEKRRRARINKCLIDLKNLLLESLKRDPAHTSKLEKADILEMTVHLLRSWQRQQLAMASSIDPSVLDRFQNGWAECAIQVANYANAVDGFNHGIRARLLKHLDLCYCNIHTTRQNFMNQTVVKGPSGAPGLFPLPNSQSAMEGRNLMLSAIGGPSGDPLAQFNPYFSPWKLGSMTAKSGQNSGAASGRSVPKLSLDEFGTKDRKHSVVTPVCSESEDLEEGDVSSNEETEEDLIFSAENPSTSTDCGASTSTVSPTQLWRPW